MLGMAVASAEGAQVSGFGVSSEVEGKSTIGSQIAEDMRLELLCLTTDAV